MSSRPGKYRATIRRAIPNGRRHRSKEEQARIDGLLGIPQPPRVLEVPVTKTNKKTAVKHIAGISLEDIERMLSLPEHYPNLRTKRVGVQPNETWTLVWDGCKEE